MVYSLMNGEKGGDPVMAMKPARKSPPDQGRRVSAPLTTSVVLFAVGAVNVAGGEKQHPFGQTVIQQMKERAVQGSLAESETDGKNPHMLDARIGQHPLEIGLAGHENSGKGHGNQSHAEQGLSEKTGSRCRMPGRSGKPAGSPERRS